MGTAKQKGLSFFEVTLLGWFQRETKGTPPNLPVTPQMLRLYFIWVVKHGYVVNGNLRTKTCGAFPGGLFLTQTHTSSREPLKNPKQTEERSKRNWERRKGRSHGLEEMGKPADDIFDPDPFNSRRVPFAFREHGPLASVQEID